MPSVLVWLRNDLRLEDNPALYHADKAGLPIIPLYILEDISRAHWPPGSASKAWLHHSLNSLQQQFRKKGSRLLLRIGNPLDIIRSLLEETGATSVYWNRRYEPVQVKNDQALKTALREAGYTAESFPGNLLREPHEIANKQGNPYKVFTPFRKAYQAMGDPVTPLPAPKKLAAPKSWPGSTSLNELGLLPAIRWDKCIHDTWQAGSVGAEAMLKSFLERIDDYDEDRNFPHRDGVSRLSPYLHFGEISARMIWHRILQLESREGRITPSARVMNYLRQLVWREFAHHLLFHYPHSSDKPLRPEFAAFPWRSGRQPLHAWQHGRTGYPIVDAGMRELWHSGWMHNRVRMIVASFLVKDLLIHWREGAKWFWDTLVDADLANNTLGWQWVAGSGADAAPYFRIFNPVTQSEKFDADGNYIRRWVPELSALDNQWIHKPWQAPAVLLQAAGITLGREYPRPIIDHAVARQRALAALKSMNDAR